MARFTPTTRQNRAFKEAAHGAVAFNGGHPLWARYYFDRAVRRDRIAGVQIGDFYASMAGFDQQRLQRHACASEAALEHAQERVFHYHWLAKNYYKRALPCAQHDVKLLQALAQEYGHLAALAGAPRDTQHYLGKADYYRQAAIDLSVDSQNQQRLAADLAQLRRA